MSCLGPASRVSRRHIIITVRNDGSFYLINIGMLAALRREGCLLTVSVLLSGKRTVYLNGRPILAGHKAPIDHNSVIEVLLPRVSVFLYLLLQLLCICYIGSKLTFRCAQLCDLRLVFFLNMPMITQFRKEIE
jgi:hypothetical protein